MKKRVKKKQIAQTKENPWVRVTREREKQLFRVLPDILESRSLLYIGANVKRMEMLHLFAEKGCPIDILEIWPQNVLGLVAWNAEQGVVANIMLGDVRDVNRRAAWDVVMWWHGPEHIAEDELPPVLERLEAAARRLVVLACPWGMVAQDAFDGNPHERHLAGLDAERFVALGYKTDTLGKRNGIGSNILAWKRL